MTIGLSNRTEQLICVLFEPEVQGPVSHLLRHDCNAESIGCAGWSESQMERIWFAVLKLGQHDLAAVRSALDLARVDWRDALVAAGFANDLDAHERWSAEMLGSRGV